jgi:hypothetical protein
MNWHGKGGRICDLVCLCRPNQIFTKTKTQTIEEQNKNETST